MKNLEREELLKFQDFFNGIYELSENYYKKFIALGYEAELRHSINNGFYVGNEYKVSKYFLPEIEFKGTSSIVFFEKGICFYYWSIPKKNLKEYHLNYINNRVEHGKLEIFGSEDYMKDFYFGDPKETILNIEMSTEKEFQVAVTLRYDLLEEIEMEKHIETFVDIYNKIFTA